MNGVVLLTWNLARREPPLKLVEDYIEQLRRKGEDYIIALQEAGDGAEAIVRRVGGEGRGNGDIVLLTSGTVRAPMLPDRANPLGIELSHTRFVGAHVEVLGRELVAFSYHGQPNREVFDPVVRGGHAAECRWLFEELAGGHDWIVMGDFNAEPRSLEVSHRACFAFQAKTDRPSRRSLFSHGRERSDVRWIAPPAQVPTLIFGGGDHAEQHVVYDFFAASSALAAEMQAEVVPELLTTKLADKEGRPTLSDHLPVRARLHSGA